MQRTTRPRGLREQVEWLRGVGERAEQRAATPEGWQAWVEFAARFPRGELSAGELMQVWQQRPSAVALETYDGWASRGRQVARGERSCGVAVPATGRQPQADGVAVVPLFDVGQTVPMRGRVGARVDDVDRSVAALDADELRTRLVRVAGQSGVEIPSDASLGEVARAVGASMAGDVDGATRDAVAGAVGHIVLTAHGVESRFDGPVPPLGSVGDVRAAASAVVTSARAVVGAVSERSAASEAAVRELVQRGQRTLESARAVADRAEVSAARVSGQEAGGDGGVASEELDRLAAVNAAAGEYFRWQLATAPDRARSIVRDRLGGRVDDRFVVGYAPAGWTGLVDHLRAAGVADQDMVDAGVAQWSRRGSLIDRFRDRFMVGVRDDAGRLAGFVGRTTAPESDVQDAKFPVPKYLNTPATALFDKSSLVFGLHEQRREVAAGATPVVVEGPLDALAMVGAAGPQSGLAPVSASGTAVTPQHVAALDAVSPASAQWLITMDGDEAGRNAATRVAEMTVGMPRDVRDVALPPEHDPASWVQAYPDRAFVPWVDEARAKPVVDLLVDERIARFADRLQWVEGRVDAMRSAVQVLAQVPPDVAADRALQLSQRLGMDPVTVAEALSEVPKSAVTASEVVAERARRVVLRDAAQMGSSPAALARGAFPAVASSGATQRAEAPRAVQSRGHARDDTGTGR